MPGQSPLATRAIDLLVIAGLEVVLILATVAALTILAY